jgi:outer membrane protein, heavy metal efflux system
MKSFIWLSTVWILSILAFPSACLALDIAVTHEDELQVNPALSLRDVLNATVKHQPQQAQLQSQAYGVKAKKTLADSFLPYSPAISLYHQNDTLGSGRGEREYEAALELPIWLPNQRDARAKVADMSGRYFEAGQASLTIRAAGLLRDALWEIALTKNALVLSEAKLVSAKTLQEKVNKSVLAGEAAKTDFLLAQQATLLASKNKVLAQAEVMHAQFRYKLVTGIDQLPESYKEQKSELIGFEQSPTWLEMLTKVESAEQSRHLAQIEKKENVQVQINARSIIGAFDAKYNQSMGVSVRIPFNIAASTTPITAASEMALGSALSERDVLRNALEAALHEADHNLEVSEQELLIAKQHDAIAKESLRLAEKAYALGEHDLATLLRIKDQAFEAERSYHATEIQHQWNIARYNQAVGVLP